MRKRILVLLLFCLSYSYGEEFLSKDFIDTTINRAYYAFVAANRGAGGEFTQSSAIKKAKAVVSDLKEKAKTDPNYRYILWRLSELENQIALEEEELFVKSRMEAVAEINKIVASFNTELKQKRPSFGALHAMHATMLNVDVSHANELADIINKHNRYMVQTLRSEMKALFARRNFVKAEEEYLYAVKNKKYLNLSSSDYKIWGQRIQAKKTADYLKKELDLRLSELESLARGFKIAKARRTLEVLQYEVDGAAKHLDSYFVNKSRTKMASTKEQLFNIEDSLVTYNLSLVKKGNTDPAVRYMKQVLVPAGVLPEKIAKVDRAILAFADHKVSDKTMKGISKEMKGFEGKRSGNLISMGGMKAKIQAKKDSIRQYQDNLEFAVDKHFRKTHKTELKAHAKQEAFETKMRTKADNFLLKMRSLIDMGKEPKADKMLAKKHDLLYRWGTAKKYYYIKTKLNAFNGKTNYSDPEIAYLLKVKEEQSEAGRQKRAEKLITDIYVALDEKSIADAYSIFYKNRQFLIDNAYDAAYSTVRLYVLKEYNKEFSVYVK